MSVLDMIPEELVEAMQAATQPAYSGAVTGSGLGIATFPAMRVPLALAMGSIYAVALTGIVGAELARLAMGKGGDLGSTLATATGGPLEAARTMGNILTRGWA